MGCKGGLGLSIGIFCSIDNRIYCWCNTMGQESDNRRWRSFAGHSRFHQALGRWYNTMHYTHPRRKPHTRSTQVIYKSGRNHGNSSRVIHNSSHNWNSSGKGDLSCRFAASRSAVLVCAYGTIYAASCHEYRYNGSTV